MTNSAQPNIPATPIVLPADKNASVNPEAKSTETQAAKPTDVEAQKKLSAEIKKSWSKLSDEDIKLFDKQPDYFYAKVKEKQGVNRDEAQKLMTTMQTASSGAKAA